MQKFFDPFNSHKQDAPIEDFDSNESSSTSNTPITKQVDTETTNVAPRQRFPFGNKNKTVTPTNTSTSNTSNTPKKAFDPLNSFTQTNEPEIIEETETNNSSKTIDEAKNNQPTETTPTNVAPRQRFPFGNKNKPVTPTNNTAPTSSVPKKAFDPLNSFTQTNEPEITEENESNNSTQQTTEPIVSKPTETAPTNVAPRQRFPFGNKNKPTVSTNNSNQHIDDTPKKAFDPLNSFTQTNEPEITEENESNNSTQQTTEPIATQPVDELAQHKTTPIVNNQEIISSEEIDVFEQDEKPKTQEFSYEGANNQQLEKAGVNINSIIVEPQNIKKEEVQEVEKSDEEKRQERIAYWKALSDKVDAIQIKEVMSLIGAKSNEDKIKNKFKMPWGDNISVKGQKWFNHNSSEAGKGAGGVGSVSLAQHIISRDLYFLNNYRKDFSYALNPDKKLTQEAVDLKFEDLKKHFFSTKRFPEIAKTLRKIAIKWLADEFGENINNDEIKATLKDFQREEKKGFIPPEPVPHHINWIKDYLVKDRFLPEELVDAYILNGKIYAGIPDWNLDKNHHIGKHYPKDKVYCVFLSKHAAECRTTCPDGGFNGFDKGFSTGSDKNVTCFTVLPEPDKAQKVVSIVEGAIDALSYHVFNPGNFVISTGGTDNLPLMIKVALETIENGYVFSIALDNDDAGNTSAKYLLDEIKLQLGEEKVQQLINKKLIIREKAENCKDWNKMLENKVLAEKNEPKKMNP